MCRFLRLYLFLFKASKALIKKHRLPFYRLKAIREIRAWMRNLRVFMTRRSVRLLHFTIKNIVESRPELFVNTLRHNGPVMYPFLTYFFIKTFADSVEESDKICDIETRVEFSNPDAYRFLKDNAVVEEQILLNCVKKNIFILLPFVRFGQHESAYRDLLVVLDELFKHGLIIKSKVSLPKPASDFDVENTTYSFISLPLVRLKGVNAAFFFQK